MLALSFIGAGYSALPGLLHLEYFVEEKYVKDFPSSYYLVAGFFYSSGAILYALKWPEKQFPGKFDNFGNSHNIFHVCCVIGAVMAWLASVRMFHERQLYACPV